MRCSAGNRSSRLVDAAQLRGHVGPGQRAPRRVSMSMGSRRRRSPSRSSSTRRRITLPAVRTTIEPSQAANACGSSSPCRPAKAVTNESCTRSSTSASRPMSRKARPFTMGACRRKRASCAHASPARDATTRAASLGPALERVAWSWARTRRRYRERGPAAQTSRSGASVVPTWRQNAADPSIRRIRAARHGARGRVGLRDVGDPGPARRRGRPRGLGVEVRVDAGVGAGVDARAPALDALAAGDRAGLLQGQRPPDARRRRRTAGSVSTCPDQLAQRAFRYALCACGNYVSDQALVTDAFDGTQGAYDPSKATAGGSVGVNGDLHPTGPMTDRRLALGEQPWRRPSRPRRP